MKKGINKENLDINVSPAQDFYQFACGGWMKKNPLPPEFSSFGIFEKLREQARIQLQDLILNLENNPASKNKGSIEQKISDLYALGMDEKRLNHEGATPLLPTLRRLNNINQENLLETIAWLHKGLDSTFFSTGVGPHPLNSDLNILHIGETGLGLGDRDYYLEKSEENDRIMAAYEKYVKTLSKLVGKDEKEQTRIWNNIIKIETDIARNKLSREKRRDPLLRFNMKSLEDLTTEFPGIDWISYFKLMNLEISEVNVTSTDFLKFISEYIKTLSPQELQDYITYSIITNSTGLLSDDFIDASFELYGKTMSGQKEQKPRWKRAMALPNSMFGEAVGKLYVDKYFPQENKDYMIKLVENLRKALKSHIENLSWMSPQTKEKAIEKLASMKVKIGYPDKWKDYSELTIDPSLSYLENVQRASEWYTEDNYSKLNKPVDKTEWHMTPQTVNAYYSPVSNEICFPAAILQSPYFDIDAEDAINYGAIGVVIGHEMTHGFDDQGRQFDKNGNLNNWWNKEDAEKFKNLTGRLVEQFNKVEVLPGMNANGEFTLGENIADQGGLRVALTAFLESLPKDEQNAVNLKSNEDQFTPLQNFYLSYANVWANNITPEEISVRTKSNPHSLGRNRVNVTLKNIKEFQKAFDIKENDLMFLPENERVIIW